MRDTEEREAETQEEGEPGSMSGAQRRTRSWDSRITSWAKGGCSATEPPRRPMPGRFEETVIIKMNEGNDTYRRPVMWQVIKSLCRCHLLSSPEQFCKKNDQYPHFMDTDIELT